nr:AAA family ATPase [Leptospira weilii]
MEKNESNDRACQIKRCKIIFRFYFPTNQDGSESIVPTICSFNDPAYRLSFIFTYKRLFTFFPNMRSNVSFFIETSISLKS